MGQLEGSMHNMQWVHYEAGHIIIDCDGNFGSSSNIFGSLLREFIVESNSANAVVWL